MKRVLGVLVTVMTCMQAVFIPMTAIAEPVIEPIPDAPKLFISQFKIGGSGNQFFEIYNNSGVEVDMAAVQLAYFNHYDMSKSSSNKLISLSGKLEPGGYYAVSDSALAVCYQTLVANVSLGFNNSNGLVQLLEFAPEEGRYVSSLLDSVAWNKNKVADAPDVLPTLADPSKSYKRNIPAHSSVTEWSPMYFDSDCNLVVEDAYEEEEDALVYSFVAGSLPPVRYVTANRGTLKSVNRNPGKAAPIINELLPNPGSPQTDAEDEFVEIYNPNESTFDLSGFKIAFGSTNPKKYTFPEGTVMQPKEFRSFTSGDTSISLSNSEAQVWLLDPNEQVIASTEPYTNAKDGQAWALNAGKWAWTLQPSPGAINTIAMPIASSDKDKSAAAALGISSNSSTNVSADPSAGGTAGKLDDAAPLHPAALVLVGLAAVGYILYEYRQDMSNKIFQFRRYLRSRQTPREQT